MSFFLAGVTNSIDNSMRIISSYDSYNSSYDMHFFHLLNHIYAIGPKTWGIKTERVKKCGCYILFSILLLDKMWMIFFLY